MLGERIKTIRLDHGYNQSDFADALHVSKSHMSKIESGKSNPSKLFITLLCSEFRVMEEWLLSGKGPKYRNSEIIRAASPEDVWNSAAGYILKYAHIAEGLSASCNLDRAIWDIFNQTNFLIVLNYIIKVFLNSRDDLDVFLQFEKALASVLPEYTTYKSQFFYITRDIASKHMDELSSTKLWKDVQAFQSCIDSPSNGLESSLELENRLLSHRVYSIHPVSNEDHATE